MVNAGGSELGRRHNLGDDRVLPPAARSHARTNLLGDPGLAARCRQVAEEHFGLERGVDELLRIYRGVWDREGRMATKALQR